MATTLDSVVQLNLECKAQRSARVPSVEKEFLQLLRSAPKHFERKTPLSAKHLLCRYDSVCRVLTEACIHYINIYLLRQGRLWVDYDK